jgi:hypothetical protein
MGLSPSLKATVIDFSVLEAPVHWSSAPGHLPGRSRLPSGTFRGVAWCVDVLLSEEGDTNSTRPPGRWTFAAKENLPYMKRSR